MISHFFCVHVFILEFSHVFGVFSFFVFRFLHLFMLLFSCVFCSFHVILFMCFCCSFHVTFFMCFCCSFHFVICSSFHFPSYHFSIFFIFSFVLLFERTLKKEKKTSRSSYCYHDDFLSEISIRCLSLGEQRLEWTIRK